MPYGRRAVGGCATMVAQAGKARRRTGSDVAPNRTSRARRRRPPSSVRPIGSGANPWKRLHAEGKRLRDAVPRRAHAGWKPAADRPDPLALIARSNADRQPDLVPIRMGRMASSVFGFYRGSAGVMAWDLAHTPVTGIHVLMDGDAHLANFGLFGTVEQDVVFDLDDFDESQPGPWEWDVKRLVASVNVAARDLGWERTERRAAAVGCARAYRREVRRLERKGALSIWYEFLFTGREGAAVPLDPVARDVLRAATQTAAQRTREGVLEHLAVRSRDGVWRFREIPPIQRRLPRALRERVLAALEGYARSLPLGPRYLLDRYRPVDVAEHVVGVGSVGARVYVVLLFGNGDPDPLLLQVKGALPPAAAPYLAPLPRELQVHQGKRVVTAQMGLQSSPDLLLGWTRVDGRAFYVRQMRNLKGSVPLEELSAKEFLRYVAACGTILGHAHARSGEAARIAGYVGRSGALDEALADFAEEYGAQMVRDHARLVRAIASGRIDAVREGMAPPRRRGTGKAHSARGPPTSRPSGGRPPGRTTPTSRGAPRRAPGSRPRPERDPGRT
jgi:uncharacterized protein (DUF2252 family)